MRPLAGRLDDRAGHGMVRARLRGGRQRQDLVLGEPAERDDLGQAHGALRHGAGLVQQDDVGGVGRFEDLAALEQDAELGRPAGPGHDRGGRRQTERARARDQQHRHRVEQRLSGFGVRRRSATRRTSQRRRASRSGRRSDEIRSASPARVPSIPVPRSRRRTISASLVLAPTVVTNTTSRPWPLIDAPTTSLPGPTSTGTDSPVSIERSTHDVPSWTTPSAGIFSPGRTITRLPGSELVDRYPSLDLVRPRWWPPSHPGRGAFARRRPRTSAPGPRASCRRGSASR